MNKTRLEAFSDGVLAIIITIMILEIRIPHSADWAELLHIVPVLLSYFLSFLFIGIYWANHHHLLHSVKQVTAGIIWANFNLLFWLSLIPIATGWMGENHFAENTVVVYSVLLLLSGIAFYILQGRIERNSHDIEALKEALSMQNRKGIVSMMIYAVSIPLAFINPLISGVLFFLVAVMWIIPDRNIEKALKEEK
jgi:uncharacterized membrane protein